MGAMSVMPYKLQASLNRTSLLELYIALAPMKLPRYLATV